MRKFLKFILVLLLIVVLCIFLCFCPSIQKFVAKKVLSQYFDSVNVAELKVGLCGVNVNQFSVQHNDLTFRFDDLKISWSPKDLFFFKTLNITSGTISNISVSLESEAKDPVYYNSKNWQPLVIDRAVIEKNLNEVLVKLNKSRAFLKFPFSIKTCCINGSFDIYEKTLGEFSAKLTNFDKSKVADLNFDLTSSFSRGFEGAFTLNTIAKIYRNAEGYIYQSDIQSSIISKNFATNIERNFNLRTGFTKDCSEIYLNFIDEKNAQEILNLSIKKKSGSDDKTLVLNLKIDNEIAEYFMFGKTSKIWTAELNGKGENSGENNNWVFKSNLDIGFTGSILSSTFSKLDDLMRLRITSSLNFSNNFLTITSFSGTLKDSNQKFIDTSFELQSLCKIGYDINHFLENLSDNLSGVHLDIDINHLDCSLLNLEEKNITLTGIGEGKFKCFVKTEGLVCTTDQSKFTLSGINLLYNKQEMLKNLDLETNINFQLKDKIILNISELSCKNSGAKTLAIQGDSQVSLDKDKCSLSGYLVVDIPELLKQSLFKNDKNVISGLASLSFDNDFDSDGIFTGNGSLKLKAVSFENQPNALDGEFAIQLKKLNDDKGISFNLDNNLHFLGKTDLEIKGELIQNSDDSSRNLQTSLKGSSLCLSDLLAFVNIFQINTFEHKQSIRENSVEDNKHRKQSFIEELCTDISIEIENMYWKQFCCLSDLTCNLKSVGTNVNVPNFKCYIFDAPFMGKFALIHKNNNSNKEIYGINTSFSLSNLNISKCVQALGYDASTFTGNFNLNGNFESEKYSLQEALSGLHGSVQLNSTPGEIKLDTFLSSTQKGILGIAGITTSVIGGKSAAINDIVDYFSNLYYDSISASLIREKDGSFVLDNFVIKNNDMKFLSRGRVYSNPGPNFKDSNIKFETQLMSKGALADMLGKLNLRSENVDYYGYYVGPEITIKGTVGHPDLSEIKNLIKQIGTSIFYDDESLVNPKNIFKIFSK